MRCLACCWDFEKRDCLSKQTKKKVPVKDSVILSKENELEEVGDWNPLGVEMT